MLNCCCDSNPEDWLISFTGILIIYSLFLFPKTHVDKHTGEKLDMGLQKKRRNVVYYICGSIMTVSLLMILAYMGFLEDKYPKGP